MNPEVYCVIPLLTMQASTTDHKRAMDTVSAEGKGTLLGRSCLREDR